MKKLILRTLLALSLIPSLLALSPGDVRVTTVSKNGISWLDQVIPVQVSMTALKAVSTASLVSGFQTNLLGFYAAGDGGGGIFVFDSASVAADNGGTIIAPASGSGRWLRVYSGGVNVRWFGAKGDAATNDSAAFNSALTLLGTAGGDIFVPNGAYKANFTVSGNGVRITGTASRSAIPSPQNYIGPFNTASPVITVGADTAGQLTRGAILKNLVIYGADTGTTGLLFTGGSYECNVVDCTVTNFQIDVQCQPGVNQLTSLIVFDRCSFAPRFAGGGASDRVIYVKNGVAYPTIYCTAIYLSNCHINGGTVGYAIENDSVGFFMSNTYVDGTGGHGLKLTKTYSPYPNCYFSNVNIDTPSGTGAAVVSFDNSVPQTYILGTNIFLNSSYQLANGSLVLWNTGNTLFNPLMTYPYTQGRFGFNDLSNPAPSQMTMGLQNSGLSYTVTVNAGTDTFTYAPTTQFANGDRVIISAATTQPGGVGVGSAYYVVGATGTTFQLSGSLGGSALDVTTTGTGTLTAAMALPYNMYAQNGTFIFEGQGGIILNDRLTGTVTVGSEGIGGYAYLRFRDFVNNKFSFVYGQNGNVFLQPTSTGQIYFQDNASSNNGGFTGTVLWGTRGCFGGSNPDASSELEVRSTTLGFLLPRMTTTQQNAIASPLAGLQIYNSTLSAMTVYNGAWQTILSGTTFTGLTINSSTIGNITPGSGAFTTLSASSTIDATGGGIKLKNNANAVLLESGSGTGVYNNVLFANAGETLIREAVAAGNISIQDFSFNKIATFRAASITLGQPVTVTSLTAPAAGNLTLTGGSGGTPASLAINAAGTTTITAGGGKTLQWDSSGNLIASSNFLVYANGSGGTVTLNGNITGGLVPAVTLQNQNSYTTSSGVEVGINLPATLAQTGTAGFTALQLDLTESTIGSGVRLLINAKVGGTSQFSVSDVGALTITGALTTLGGATFHTTTSALTNGAGASAGTITNAPAIGNPTKWVGINDNGTTRYIPAW